MVLSSPASAGPPPIHPPSSPQIRHRALHAHHCEARATPHPSPASPAGQASRAPRAPLHPKPGPRPEPPPHPASAPAFTHHEISAPPPPSRHTTACAVAHLPLVTERAPLRPCSAAARARARLRRYLLGVECMRSPAAQAHAGCPPPLVLSQLFPGTDEHGRTHACSCKRMRAHERARTHTHAHARTPTHTYTHSERVRDACAHGELAVA